jgi:hypothetical protein
MFPTLRFGKGEKTMPLAGKQPPLPPIEDVQRVEPRKVEFVHATSTEEVPPVDSIARVEPWNKTLSEQVVPSEENETKGG